MHAFIKCVSTGCRFNCPLFWFQIIKGDRAEFLMCKYYFVRKQSARNLHELKIVKFTQKY